MKKNSEFDLFFEKADVIYLHQHAGVAELADALRSGRSGSNPVGVQIPPPVYFKRGCCKTYHFATALSLLARQFFADLA